MRRAVMGGVALVALASDVWADDYLRGSYNWAGVYGGGTAGIATVGFGFSKATRPLVADIARSLLVESEAHISQLPSLPNKDGSGASYGGFIGYNWVWEGGAILGVELNYSRTSVAANSSDAIGRAFTTSNEFLNDVFIASNASARLTDYATLRMRAGYATNWMMFYGMLGLAAGRADYMRATTVSIQETDVSAAALDPADGIPPRPGGSLNESRTDAKTGAIAYGWMGGLGVDMGLFDNLFLRGEWEFVQFAKIGGIALNVNTFRVGGGLKF